MPPQRDARLLEVTPANGDTGVPAWQAQIAAHFQGEARYAALPLRADARGFWLGDLEVDSPEQLVKFARAQWRESHWVAGKQLIFDHLRIRYGDDVLYDRAQEFIAWMHENLEHARRGEPAHMNMLDALEYRPLSLVGTVLTYETTLACACGGGPPGSEIAWVSVDLATGRAPHPLDLFDEASLVAAMKNDSCIGATLSPAQHRDLDSWEQVRAAFSQSPNPQSNCLEAADAFQRIAIVDFDGELVTTRFGFPHSISPGHTKTSYFGMHLRPWSGFAVALRRVREGEGFFLSAPIEQTEIPSPKRDLPTTLVVEFVEGTSSQPRGLPQAIAEATWIARGTLLELGTFESARPGQSPVTEAVGRVRLDAPLKGHLPAAEISVPVILHHPARHYRAPSTVVRSTVSVGEPVVVFGGIPRNAYAPVQDHLESAERLAEIRAELDLHQNPGPRLSDAASASTALYHLHDRASKGEALLLSHTDRARLRKLAFSRAPDDDLALSLLVTLRDLSPESKAVYRRAIRQGRLFWIGSLGGTEGIELGLEAFQMHATTKVRPAGYRKLLEFLGGEGDERAARALRASWQSFHRDDHLIALIEATLLAGSRFPGADWAAELPLDTARMLQQDDELWRDALKVRTLMDRSSDPLDAKLKAGYSRLRTTSDRLWDLIWKRRELFRAGTGDGAGL